MKKNIFLMLLIFVFQFFGQLVMAKQSAYFEKGFNLFKNNNHEESKIFFERDIVFNPKNEESYLYLAKIFNKDENEEQEEINLNNVLLLNPKNDEAIYMLILLKIKQSDYDHVKKLIDQFSMVCKSLCYKKTKIQKSFKKLIPENEKNNN